MAAWRPLQRLADAGSLAETLLSVHIICSVLLNPSTSLSPQLRNGFDLRRVSTLLNCACINDPNIWLYVHMFAQVLLGWDELAAALQHALSQLQANQQARAVRTRLFILSAMMLGIVL